MKLVYKRSAARKTHSDLSTRHDCLRPVILGSLPPKIGTEQIPHDIVYCTEMLQLGAQAAAATVQLAIHVDDRHALGQVPQNFLSKLVVSSRVRDPADD